MCVENYELSKSDEDETNEDNFDDDDHITEEIQEIPKEAIEFRNKIMHIVCKT